MVIVMTTLPAKNNWFIPFLVEAPELYFDIRVYTLLCSFRLPKSVCIGSFCIIPMNHNKALTHLNTYSLNKMY